MIWNSLSSTQYLYSIKGCLEVASHNSRVRSHKSRGTVHRERSAFKSRSSDRAAGRLAPSEPEPGPPLGPPRRRPTLSPPPSSLSPSPPLSVPFSFSPSRPSPLCLRTAMLRGDGMRGGLRSPLYPTPAPLGPWISPAAPAPLNPPLRPPPLTAPLKPPGLSPLALRPPPVLVPLALKAPGPKGPTAEVPAPKVAALKALARVPAPPAEAPPPRDVRSGTSMDITDGSRVAPDGTPPVAAPPAGTPRGARCGAPLV